jgi:hypothetical protein
MEHGTEYTSEQITTNDILAKTRKNAVPFRSSVRWKSNLGTLRRSGFLPSGGCCWNKDGSSWPARSGPPRPEWAKANDSTGLPSTWATMPRTVNDGNSVPDSCPDSDTPRPSGASATKRSGGPSGWGAGGSPSAAGSACAIRLAKDPVHLPPVAIEVQHSQTTNKHGARKLRKNWIPCHLHNQFMENWKSQRAKLIREFSSSQERFM